MTLKNKIFNSFLKWQFVLIILCYGVGKSQIAQYNKINKRSKFEMYVTKSGDTLKIGDTLTIGTPTTDQGFAYITQGSQKTHPKLSNKKVKIHKLRSYGSKRSGYKLYVQFKGYGLLPVNIDYETARKKGEIINKNAKPTRKQAIEKLKEAKDLLELDMMTKKEFEKLKKELEPIIMKND